MDLYYHAAKNVVLLVSGNESIDVLKNMYFAVVAAYPLWDTEQSGWHACHDGHEFQLPHILIAS